MTTESTSTAREMSHELFESFSAQFDALTQAIEDAGFPVLHTCLILRGETDNALNLSSMSAIRSLRGTTMIRMAATAAAQSVTSGLTTVLKDETGNIPAEQLMQLTPMTKAVTDEFMTCFTQAMAAHISQALNELGHSGERWTKD